MSIYTGADTRSVHDNDLYYFNAVAWSAASVVSDTIDLGAEQKFMEIPAHIMWDFSADFSIVSSLQSTAPFLGIKVQDSADGSTWAGSILCIPFNNTALDRITGASTISSTLINGRNVGIGSIKRYSRLAIDWGTAPGVTVSAWLRLGLTK